MSNLVDHARHELQLIGEEPEFIEGYLKVIQAFADMGHSGVGAIQVLNQLLRYKNLSPLTDDPSEWIHHGPEIWGGAGAKGVWQSRRNTEAFSDDGGKTYSLVSDEEQEDGTYPLYDSEVSGKAEEPPEPSDLVYLGDMMPYDPETDRPFWERLWKALKP